MKRYTEREHEFLRGFIPGHTSREVAEEFNARFHPGITPGIVRAYKHNHGIKSGTRKGFAAGRGTSLWPDPVREFVLENNRGKSAVEMVELLKTAFGLSYTPGQVKAFRARNHLHSGLTGRFEKGLVPANKGKKGWCAPGSEKGWFRKGREPHNRASVGTEVLATMGYIKVKVAEPDVWKFKHIMEWEKHNGRVPDGCVITFKDGDHRNCSIENLMCISFRENSQLNGRKLRTVSPELTEAGLALVRLENRVKELMEERKR